jgi:hypothetical protein|nr:MAG TPA: hypothetical protein [Caudoviricetes sp.]
MVELNMNTKLLKIIDDLGWIHEEEGVVSIWFQREFSPAHLDKLIKEFKNKCLNEFEEYNIKIGSVIWNEDTKSYVMDYTLEGYGLFVLRDSYDNDNLVNEHEDKTFEEFSLNINIYKEINLMFVENVIKLTEENILQDDFVVVVLNEDKERVEQIFEEAYQRLK